LVIGLKTLANFGIQYSIFDILNRISHFANRTSFSGFPPSLRYGGQAGFGCLGFGLKMKKVNSYWLIG
jgi:hypothetical protein